MSVVKPVKKIYTGQSPSGVSNIFVSRLFYVCSRSPFTRLRFGKVSSPWSWTFPDLSLSFKRREIKPLASRYWVLAAIDAASLGLVVFGVASLHPLELLERRTVMRDVVASHVPLVLHHLAALLAAHLATLAVHVHDVLKHKLIIKAKGPRQRVIILQITIGLE